MTSLQQMPSGVGELCLPTLKLRGSTSAKVDEEEYAISPRAPLLSTLLTNNCFILGEARFGQLGTGARPASHHRPVPCHTPMVVAGDASWACISLGTVHAAAITAEGKLFSWGLNSKGQCGVAAPDPVDQGRTTYYPGPARVKASAMGSTFKAVSCGGEHTLVLSSRGVAAWGSNARGQLGLGSGAPLRVWRPMLVPALARMVVTQLSCGVSHSLVLTEQSQVFAWGANERCQLGLGDDEDRAAPCLVMGLWGMPVTRLAAGNAHSLALTITGALYAWGSNHYGQCGVAAPEPAKPPAAVQTIEVPVAEEQQLTQEDTVLRGQWLEMMAQMGIEVQLAHLSLDATNSHGVEVAVEWLFSQNEDELKMLILHRELAMQRPATAGSSSSNNSSQMAEHPCLPSAAVSRPSSKRRSSWKYEGGAAEEGVPELESENEWELVVLEPQQVPLQGVRHIATGQDFCLAMCGGGEVFAWGCGASGALGLGDTNDRDVPTRVVALEHLAVDKVVCGVQHSLFVTRDGRVFGCGHWESGQLGSVVGVAGSFVTVPQQLSLPALESHGPTMGEDHIDSGFISTSRVGTGMVSMRPGSALKSRLTPLSRLSSIGRQQEEPLIPTASETAEADEDCDVVTPRPLSPLLMSTSFEETNTVVHSATCTPDKHATPTYSSGGCDLIDGDCNTHTSTSIMASPTVTHKAGAASAHTTTSFLPRIQPLGTQSTVVSGQNGLMFGGSMLQPELVVHEVVAGGSNTAFIMRTPSEAPSPLQISLLAKLQAMVARAQALQAGGGPPTVALATALKSVMRGASLVFSCPAALAAALVPHSRHVYASTPLHPGALTPKHSVPTLPLDVQLLDQLYSGIMDLIGPNKDPAPNNSLGGEAAALCELHRYGLEQALLRSAITLGEELLGNARLLGVAQRAQVLLAALHCPLTSQHHLARQLLPKLCSAVLGAPAACRRLLVKWWSLYPPELLQQRLVQPMQSYVSKELSSTKKLTTSIMLVIKVLARLAAANTLAGNPLLPEVFYNTLISEKMDVQDHYSAWRATQDLGGAPAGLPSYVAEPDSDSDGRSSPPVTMQLMWMGRSSGQGATTDGIQPVSDGSDTSGEPSPTPQVISPAEPLSSGTMRLGNVHMRRSDPGVHGAPSPAFLPSPALRLAWESTEAQPNLTGASRAAAAVPLSLPLTNSSVERSSRSSTARASGARRWPGGEAGRPPLPPRGTGMPSREDNATAGAEGPSGSIPNPSTSGTLPSTKPVSEPGPFSFCSYPFLLDARAKSNLLHIEARFQMEQTVAHARMEQQLYGPQTRSRSTSASHLGPVATEAGRGLPAGGSILAPPDESDMVYNVLLKGEEAEDEGLLAWAAGTAAVNPNSSTPQGSQSPGQQSTPSPTSASSFRGHTLPPRPATSAASDTQARHPSTPPPQSRSHTSVYSQLMHQGQPRHSADRLSDPGITGHPANDGTPSRPRRGLRSMLSALLRGGSIRPSAGGLAVLEQGRTESYKLPRPTECLMPGVHSDMCMIRVRRTHLVEDSLDEITRQMRRDLFKPLRVHFIGEDGIDAGGVKKEWFALLLAELLRPEYALMEMQAESNTYWFPRHPVCAPHMYRMLGLILGLAVYNRVLLDFPLPMTSYRKLLGQVVGLRDLQEMVPLLGRSAAALLQYEGDVESDLCLTWAVEGKAWGVHTLHELRPGGAELPVTEENRAAYVEALVDFHVTTSVRCQFDAFTRGFGVMCNGPALRLFNAQELERLVCGNPHLDFNALQGNAKYEGGYTANSPVVVWLWDVVCHELPLEEKKRFLKFFTGSDRAPIGGLGSLRCVIQRAGPDSARLPTSHTCFNTMLMPEYNSRAKLLRQVRTAIHNAEGFGLE